MKQRCNMKATLHIWQLLPIIGRKLMVCHQFHPFLSTIVAVNGP